MGLIAAAGQWLGAVGELTAAQVRLNRGCLLSGRIGLSRNPIGQLDQRIR